MKNKKKRKKSIPCKKKPVADIYSLRIARRVSRNGAHGSGSVTGRRAGGWGDQGGVGGTGAREKEKKETNREKRERAPNENAGRI